MPNLELSTDHLLRKERDQIQQYRQVKMNVIQQTMVVEWPIT